MKAELKIGLIQPVIDPEISWNKKTPYRLNVHPVIAERVWLEIIEGFRLLLAKADKPDIILIPELHLPYNKISAIKNICKRHNIMIIAGVDFQRNPIHPHKIRNRAIISIPSSWGKNSFASRQTTLHFGKTYFTYMERSMFNNIEGDLCIEDPEQNMYVFQSSEYGNFGVMICSDIFDIERLMLYQARIHHLFIISLNKDLEIYFSMSETLSRLLFCNIIICNTGHFGGTTVVSPYREAYERTLYKYQGRRTPIFHQVAVPVADLETAQLINYSQRQKDLLFKASPPGYYDKKKALTT